MKSAHARVPLVLLLAFSLVYMPVSAGGEAVGKAVPRAGTTTLNNLALKTETTLFAGDTVATAKGGLALVFLSGGNQVNLGPDTVVAVLESDTLAVSLTRGIIAVRSGENPAALNAAGVFLRPASQAFYEVAIDRNAVVVSSHRGDVEVQGTNQPFVVPSGKTMRFELAQNTALGPTGVGANNLGAGAIIAIVAVIATATVTTALAIKYHNDRDDAQEACQALAAAASPAVPVPPECE